MTCFRLVALTFVLWLAITSPVSAHAELAGWSLKTGVEGGDRLLLDFSEKVDLLFAAVQVYDAQGHPVGAASPRRDPGGPARLVLSLPTLPAGRYTAAWRVRAVDGDVSQGTFAFYSGAARRLVAALPPVGARDPATQTPMSFGATAWDALLRWLSFIGGALIVGAAGFALLVWSPLADKVAGSRRGVLRLQREIQRILREQAASGAIVLLFASLFLMLLQVSALEMPVLQASGDSPPSPLPASRLANQVPAVAIGQVLSTPFGLAWVARVLLAATTLVVTWRLSRGRGSGSPSESRDGPPAGPGKRRVSERASWILVAVAGAGICATFSFTAHAESGAGGGPSLLLDWTHSLAMSLWLGGLPSLLIALRAIHRYGPRPASQLLVPAFSRVALPCVVWAAVTGLYAFRLQVGRPSLLTLTIYGWALAAKLILFGLLVLMGALNRQVLIPRLRRAHHHSGSFQWSLSTEIVLGLLLLSMVGTMTSLATSRTAWAAHETLGIAQSRSTRGVEMVLRLMPGTPGSNAYAVDVTDRRTDALAAAGSVILVVAGVRQPPAETIATAVIGTGRYQGVLDLNAPVQLSVVFQRKALPQVIERFSVQPSTAGPSTR